jgi:hypothetical protein
LTGFVTQTMEEQFVNTVLPGVQVNGVDLPVTPVVVPTV